MTKDEPTFRKGRIKSTGAQEKETMETRMPMPGKSGYAAVNRLNYHYAVYGMGGATMTGGIVERVAADTRRAEHCLPRVVRIA